MARVTASALKLNNLKKILLSEDYSPGVERLKYSLVGSF